jgi:hypothetical protein
MTDEVQKSTPPLEYLRITKEWLKTKKKCEKANKNESGDEMK